MIRNGADRWPTIPTAVRPGAQPEIFPVVRIVVRPGISPAAPTVAPPETSRVAPTVVLRGIFPAVPTEVQPEISRRGRRGVQLPGMSVRNVPMIALLPVNMVVPAPGKPPADMIIALLGLMMAPAGRSGRG